MAQGSELFIVDNSDRDWKVLRYLKEWAELSRGLDVATAYFEIGGLLAMADSWRGIDKIRILMGDEVSWRTKDAFTKALCQITGALDGSLEAEKEKNDFLEGVPAVVAALQSRQIECRAYRKDKFHAKAYITHARKEVIGSAALVGSSNFTRPGLCNNVELNVQVTGAPVTALQEWYEKHWKDAEDVTPDILNTVERHTRHRTPFEVYARSLYEFFRGHELTAGEWERSQSKMFPVLDEYQREAYGALMKIAHTYGGAFLCDGVGLGKTFVGLMLIERLIRDRKKVALFTPKANREAVWERAIEDYLPHVGGFAGAVYTGDLAIFCHTDLGRGGNFEAQFKRTREMADVVIIDEAHHFRNPGRKGTDPEENGEEVEREHGGRFKGHKPARPSRYRLLSEIISPPEGTDRPPKQVFLLTATPVNNRLSDLRHMIELFSRENDHHFARCGIHSVRGHFIKMERDLKQLAEDRGQGDVDIETTAADAEQILVDDSLFKEIVVQRSRAYAKKSQLQHGATAASFPEREPPKVAEYSIKRTYGRILDMLEKAFHKEKPLFSLAIYYPLFYYQGSDETIDNVAENRQIQVVGLVRTQFLKRFESSVWAFERSCERLMLRLLAFAKRHSETPTEKSRFDRWKMQNGDLVNYVHKHQMELFDGDEEDADEDIVTEEMLETVKYLARDEYKVSEMLQETLLDLDEIAKFLNALKDLKPAQDDKVKALIKLLKTDPVLKKHKVLIFTEFADTARYLAQQLREAGIQGAEQIDSGSKKDRAEIIRRFSPYYNGTSSSYVQATSGGEIRVLISTDVLSEGLNLQDATRLINYDIHWNPVRLMQRIGRVDRRLNPGVEKRLLDDHPDQAPLRGKVAYWNFLPPDEINELLTLYSRVTHKTLRISKTLGIEHGKLLRPDDNYEVLREFNEAFEGETTRVEEMHLELRQLLKDHEGLEDRLKNLPGRIFSGRNLRTVAAPGARSVFFCYVIPGPDQTAKRGNGDIEWTEQAGRTRWFLYDLDSQRIIEEPTEIVEVIRCTPDEPRLCRMEQPTLVEIRKRIEKHITQTQMRAVQAPVGVRPVLKAWMELN